MRLAALLFLPLLTQAGYVPDGFWANRDNGTADYKSYLRIKDSSGFYCVMDGKSSFRFKITGDSINTPLNGNDAIHWYPGSGDIQIDGEEKGVPYRDRFQYLAPKDYPKACVDEEARLYPSVIRKPLPSIRPGSSFWNYDLLGRVPFAR